MPVNSDSFYNAFSFLYPLVDLFLRAQKRVVFREINSLPEGDLLEIGVGNASHFQWYNRHRITGIDTSTAMLSIAEARGFQNIRTLLMDGSSMSFSDERFDYVVMSHVIAVVNHPEQLLAEVYRVLKPGGRLFILNHFTPVNWLGYIDRAVMPLSRLLRFRSAFYLADLKTLNKFKPINEVGFGIGSYFKLVVYQKA